MEPPPRMLRLAEREAHKSVLPHRLGAVAVKHGRVLGRGYNAIRKHRFSGIYPYPESLHAEAAALLNLDTRGCDLYVVRVNRQGEWRLAKPCASCLFLLKSKGVKRIMYSNNEGGYDLHEG